MDVEKDCEDALILCAVKVEGRKKKPGMRDGSTVGRAALHSVLLQHFQADYLKPHFYSIFNLTATGSVTAAVLCAILFLNQSSIPA